MWAHKPCLYGTEFAWSQCQIVSTFNMSLALKFMIIFQNLTVEKVVRVNMTAN